MNERPDNDRIWFNSAAFLADKAIHACRPEAIGVYMYLFSTYNPATLSLEGDKKYEPLVPRHNIQGKLRVFADYINEHYPTKDPYQTYRGLRDLYDKGIIEMGEVSISITKEHYYVVDENCIGEGT